MSKRTRDGGMTWRQRAQARSHVARLWLALPVAILGPALWAGGCNRQRGALARGSTVEVQMVGLRFVPSAVTIPPGTTVVWVNRDNTAHTSTSDGWRKSKNQADEWNSFPLSPGQTFARQFDTRGTFPYYCMVHPYMQGVVTVQ